MTVYPWDKWKSPPQSSSFIDGEFIGELMDFGDIRRSKIDNKRWFLPIYFEVARQTVWYNLYGTLPTMHFMYTHKDLFVGELYKLKIKTETHSMKVITHIERIRL